MNKIAKNTTSTIIPGMSYRNAPKAIEWLCDTLGFEKHAVYPNADGTIILHAELTFGNGMIMLGSATTERDTVLKHPDEIGRANTRSVNLIASDPDELYNRAKAAGAEIVLEIMDKHYGGRGFGVRDPEGHLWYVDSYDPWHAQP